MESWLDCELKAFNDVITQAEGGEIFTGCTGICVPFTFSTTLQVVAQSI